MPCLRFTGIVVVSHEIVTHPSKLIVFLVQRGYDTRNTEA
jgi:hypothetical protein